MNLPARIQLTDLDLTSSELAEGLGCLLLLELVTLAMHRENMIDFASDIQTSALLFLILSLYGSYEIFGS